MRYVYQRSFWKVQTLLFFSSFSNFNFTRSNDGGEIVVYGSEQSLDSNLHPLFVVFVAQLMCEKWSSKQTAVALAVYVG
jgi:hypothetical protein